MRSHVKPTAIPSLDPRLNAFCEGFLRGLKASSQYDWIPVPDTVEKGLRKALSGSDKISAGQSGCGKATCSCGGRCRCNT